MIIATLFILKVDTSDGCWLGNGWTDYDGILFESILSKNTKLYINCNSIYLNILINITKL